ncbi:MAG: arginine--tRNA ligase [Candidatus Dormibacteraeota bacterium]|nr:arginine--tRNA ligase [Candidatus Dormibacteraeota bacterium]MBV9525127.1 arginine--tRNA ligase [Candidatus Dormibacteraeota bacterium]
MLDVRSALVDAVRSALDALGARVDAVVEPSARPEFGDWSTPAPLAAARVLRRAPLQIAEDLRAQLANAPLELVREWTVTPPGYVNATLQDGVWARQVIAAALQLDPGVAIELPAGYSRAAGKTLVEHTATNPNKAAHIGHLRNACIGDTVGRVLRRTGHQVEVDNYIDDTGVQVADVVVGIRDLGLKPEEGEPFDQFCSRVYVEVSRRYEATPELQHRRAEVLHGIERGDPDVTSFVRDLTHRVVDAHLATMRRFDIEYDLLTWESDIITLGFWRQAFELLRDSGAIVLAEQGKHAGCWVMPPEGAEQDTDDDETKVLVKSDGVATYTAKDIAYQMWKFGLIGRDFHYRVWDASTPDSPVTTASHEHSDEVPPHFGHAQRVVNVIDARQAYPQQIVQRALRRLGHEREADSSIHLAYEVVALTPAAAGVLGVDVSAGRELYALSGRHGIEVRADDLLDRAVERIRDKARDAQTALLVAAGAVRYYLLRFSLTQIIAFDFDEALRVTGDTGVYLQYAYARASGILRKVPDDGGELVVPDSLQPVERAVLHRVDGYRRALAEAATGLAPSVLTTYAFALASSLSDFYEHTPAIVRETDPVVRRFRRALVAATRATLGDALRTLGMAAPNQI